MAKSQRWMRLDTGIFDSEWVYLLDPLAQLAWIRLLLHVKTEGVKGTAKALSIPVACKKWGIPESDIQAMLTAAREDGALAEGAEWSVTNWLKYQESPSTERVRKHRALQSDDVTPESVTERYTCRVTETETETERYINTQEEDSQGQPEGSPVCDALPWYEEEGSEDVDVQEVARKIAATRINSKGRPFPYRGVTVAHAKKALKALEPCPTEALRELFWASWYEFHSKQSARWKPYRDLGATIANWASRNVPDWEKHRRLLGYQQERQAEHDRPPVWKPGVTA